MKRFITKTLARSTIIALVCSTLSFVVPAHAATPTDVSDTMSRLKISVTSVDHTLSLTLPSMSTGNYIIFDYQTAGFSSLAQNGSSGSCASGTCSMTVSATDVKITCDTGTCSGLFTQTGTFTATNPGTAGSKVVNYSSSGPESVAGSFAIGIADDDQVTVTATVTSSMNFDLDVATSDSNTDAPYTVALGNLSTGAVTGSDDSSIAGIWVDLSSNASGGVSIQVKNANGSNGLVSASAGSDNINNSAGAMSAGTENYGICVSSAGLGVPSATTGTFQVTASSDFDGTCGATPSSDSVGTLSTTFGDILDSNSAPLTGGRAQIRVMAAISSTTPSHDDYSDTLTFRATATF